MDKLNLVLPDGGSWRNFTNSPPSVRGETLCLIPIIGFTQSVRNATFLCLLRQDRSNKLLFFRGDGKHRTYTSNQIDPQHDHAV